MPGLTLSGSWDAEEEVLALEPRGHGPEVAVVRPSLPVVVLGPGGRVGWSDSSHQALCARWSRSGTFLAIGDSTGTVRVFSPPESQPRCVLSVPSRWVSALAWGPRDEVLAVAAGKSVSWWKIPSGEADGVWSGASSTVADLDWTGGPLAACGYGGVWVFGAGSPPRTLPWQGSSLRVRWSPDLKWVATADQDKTVHLWPWPRGDDLMMGSFDAKSLSFAWTPSGSHLATSGSVSLLLWDCRGKGPGGRSPAVGAELGGLVTGLAFGHRWATVDDAGGLAVWDASPRQRARTDLGAPGVAVKWLGESLVTANQSGMVAFWSWEEEPS